MSPQTEMDKNLLVVTAIQGYAANHNISESATYEKFAQHDMISLIREQYDALHTQDLEETVAFAEDVMKRYEKSENIHKMPHYTYKNQDITIDILMKIEHVVRILAEKHGKSFDEMLQQFYASKTFAALKNTESCMWAESAEFIADDFEREQKND